MPDGLLGDESPSCKAASRPDPVACGWEMGLKIAFLPSQIFDERAMRQCDRRGLAHLPTCTVDNATHLRALAWISPWRAELTLAPGGPGSPCLEAPCHASALGFGRLPPDHLVARLAITHVKGKICVEGPMLWTLAALSRPVAAFLPRPGQQTPATMTPLSTTCSGPGRASASARSAPRLGPPTGDGGARAAGSLRMPWTRACAIGGGSIAQSADLFYSPACMAVREDTQCNAL